MRATSISGLLLVGFLTACGGTVAEDPESTAGDQAMWAPCLVGDPTCEYKNGTACYTPSSTSYCCEPAQGKRQTCTCMAGKWSCPVLH
jgi:hypothetical protein